MKVISLAKRRAWRDLKRRLQEGLIIQPRPEVRQPAPTTDAGIAFAYLVESLTQQFQKQEG